MMQNKTQRAVRPAQTDVGRPNQVWRYNVSTAGLSKPVVVKEDPDLAMRLGVWRTGSGRYMLLQGASDASNYVMTVDATKPTGVNSYLAPCLRLLCWLPSPQIVV